MNKTIVKFCVLAMAGILVWNCSGSKGPDLSPDANRKTIKSAPDWYIHTPDSIHFRYSSSSATSQDMQLAVSKAELDAASQLARTINSEMNGLTKRAQEETGLGPDSHIIDQFSLTQEQVLSTALQDYAMVKKEIQEESSDTGKIYRAYVLLEWDESAAHKRLLEKIKQDEQLYTMMRSTELFEEMEQKVEEYRQRYNR